MCVARVEASHRALLEHFRNITDEAKAADNAYVEALIQETLEEFVDGNGQAQGFLKRLQLASCTRAQKVVGAVRLLKLAILLSRRLA